MSHSKQVDDLQAELNASRRKEEERSNELTALKRDIGNQKKVFQESETALKAPPPTSPFPLPLYSNPLTRQKQVTDLTERLNNVTLDKAKEEKRMKSEHEAAMKQLKQAQEKREGEWQKRFASAEDDLSRLVCSPSLPQSLLSSFFPVLNVV